MNHYKSASSYVQDLAFGADRNRAATLREQRKVDEVAIVNEVEAGGRVRGSSGIINTCHVREAIANFKRILSCPEEMFNQYIHPGQGAIGTLKPRGGGIK